MRTTQLNLLISGITVLLLSTGTAHGEDECGCNQILDNGVFQTNVLITADHQKEVQKAFLCTTDIGTIRKIERRSGRSSGTFFDVVDFDLSGDNREENFNEWKRTSCSSDDIAQNRDYMYNEIREIADRNILDAFNDCKIICRDKKGGLFCKLRWVDTNMASFTARFVNSIINQPIPVITDGQFTGGSQISHSLSGGQPLKVGAMIPSVGSGLTSIFRATDQATKIIINLETDIAGSCTAETPDLLTAYGISVTISGRGITKLPVSNSRKERHWSEGSCNEGHKIVTYQSCLATNAVVTNVTLSGQGGTAWHRESVNPHPTKKNCGVLKLEYKDNGRNGFGDCRGTR